MSAYPPPNEDLPFFNPIEFQSNTSNVGLTIDKAKELFLEFPTAQGLENLQTINVNGASTFNDQATIKDLLTIQQPTPSLNALNIENDNASGYAIRATSFNNQATAGVLTQISSSSVGSLNPIVQATDSVICASINDTNETGALVLTTQSATSNGIRINATETKMVGDVTFEGNATFSGTSDIIQQAGSQILQQPASTGVFTNDNILNATSIYTSNGASTIANFILKDTVSNNQLQFIPNASANYGDKIVELNDFVITPLGNTKLVLTSGGAEITNGIRIDKTQLLMGFGGNVDIPTNHIKFNTLDGITLTSPVPPTSTATQPASTDSSTKMPTTAWVQSAITDTAGSVNITDTNTSATYYPTFVDGSGTGKILRADIGTTPFSLNPNTGDFNLADTLKITQSQLALGKTAGLTQGSGSVAVGVNAGVTQASNAVAIGNESQRFGGSAGNSVAIGFRAGETQLANSVAVGVNAGKIQSANAVAIGNGSQSISGGDSSVAIGANSGKTQLANSVAIGVNAGTDKSSSAVAIGINTQVTNGSVGAVAIGTNAGNSNQGQYAVAIGASAGKGTTTGQGNNSIAIGNSAGQLSQTANSICLNASGLALNPNQAGFFVNPIRVDTTKFNQLQYDTATKEMVSFPAVISPITTSGLDITGNTNLLSATSGPTSGLHLVVVINGVPYKIKLEEV